LDILKYIVEEALIVIPVLWVIGKLLKDTPKIQNWLIPWVLLVIGVLATMGIMGFTIESAIQGVLVAGASVFGHQLLKQTQNR
jgi:hypothetical protein